MFIILTDNINIFGVIFANILSLLFHCTSDIGRSMRMYISPNFRGLQHRYLMDFTMASNFIYFMFTTLYWFLVSVFFVQAICKLGSHADILLYFIFVFLNLIIQYRKQVDLLCYTRLQMCGHVGWLYMWCWLGHIPLRILMSQRTSGRQYRYISISWCYLIPSYLMSCIAKQHSCWFLAENSQCPVFHSRCCSDISWMSWPHFQNFCFRPSSSE